MVLRNSLLVLVGGIALSLNAGNKILVDRVEAVVFGTEFTDVITLSEVKKPGLDGQMRDVQARVTESQTYQEALGMKMIDKDAVEKNFKGVQRDNNLSDQDALELFKTAGYNTFEEGLKAFERLTGSSQMVGFKVGSKMAIPEKDILAYWQANPVFLEPSYQLERAVIQGNASATTKDLKQQLIDKKVTAQWSPPFWVDHPDLAEDKQFIAKLKKGQVNIAKKDNLFELFRLVDKKEKRPVPLEERRAEIERILQPVRYRELFGAYKKELDEKMPHITF